MDVIGVDTETTVVDVGIPDLVVLSIDGVLVHHTEVTPELVRELFARPCAYANAPFDVAVLAKHAGCWDEAWEAYERELVFDVLIRQRLLDIAAGTFMRIHPPRPKRGKRASPYSLEGVAWRHGFVKDGQNPWRMRYGELRDTPIAWWPADAVEYAEHDSLVTRDVFKAQEASIKPEGVFVDQHRQNRKAWALYLAERNGIPVDPEAVEKYAKQCEDERAEHRERLREAGILRDDGTRDEKLARAFARVAGVRQLTPGGEPSLSREACEESNDPVLISYARDEHLGKMLNTYVTALRRAPRLCGSYSPLQDTGRTSMRAPNLQNLPRAPGVRECLVADPGRVLISVDVEKAELVSLAQILLALFGPDDINSPLANALRNGADPNNMIGAQILGISLDEFNARRGEDVIENARQDGKPGNYGFSGGMGPATYVKYSKQQGRPITLERAYEIRDAFRRTWPDIVEYLRWIDRLAETTTSVTQYKSGRLRGGLGYCDMANGFFQGLTADAMGEVLWELAKAQRTWDSKTLVFIHDEVIVDAREDECHDIAQATRELVERVYARWTPDIPVTAGAAAMRRWSKKAKAQYVQGRLVPWTPCSTSQTS